ncbi:lipoprotein, partial [Escherichia coli]|nr:lipoprotein [Escherichia coli]
MKKTLLAAGAVLALSSSFTVNAAENDKPQYLSDWWHQSVNVVGSYHTRFGPQIRNDTYLECVFHSIRSRIGIEVRSAI